MSVPSKTDKSPTGSSSHRARVGDNSIGSIMRAYGERYIKEYSISYPQLKLLRSMRLCKSPAMGGQAIKCETCGDIHHIYHSCGHSNCPICQSIKREQWVDKLRSELLHVPYVHMVFTLPHELHGLARRNQRALYSLIMRMSWKTVKALSEDEKNIGGLPGMIAVLHTFGSDMKYHIHTHCLVTFGGLNRESEVWKRPSRKDKIGRYRSINKVYKELFLAGLKKLYEGGKIDYRLNYEEVEALIIGKNWVVHNTKPTIDTRLLENYLARYINRIAISNGRVNYLSEEKKVQLIYNDYKNQQAGEAAPKAYKDVDPLVFIDQFMQHVLPPYFQKSRRYGLHASATKKKLKEVLPKSIQANSHVIRSIMEIVGQLLKLNPYRCEKCQSSLFSTHPIVADKEWVYRFINIPKTRPPP